MSPSALRRLVGWTALGASVLYILSDLVELLGRGFSSAQLYATYVAFVAVPFFVLGLHALQGPRAGWLSLSGAVSYGVAFIFYAATAVHALVAGTSDYAALVGALGTLYTVHGGLLVVGGVLFGVAAVRAGVWPRWTGVGLIIGALLSLLFYLLRLPDTAQVAGSTIRNVAFIGMAAAALRGGAKP